MQGSEHKRKNQRVLRLMRKSSITSLAFIVKYTISK